jgi:hypothetical protein
MNLLADVLPIPSPPQLMLAGGVMLAVVFAVAAGIYFVVVRMKKPKMDERLDQKP